MMRLESCYNQASCLGSESMFVDKVGTYDEAGMETEKKESLKIHMEKSRIFSFSKHKFSVTEHGI